MTCSSFQSQIDIANNIFTPAAALSTNIGLCRVSETYEKFGILMVRNNGIWGSVGVFYFQSYQIIALEWKIKAQKTWWDLVNTFGSSSPKHDWGHTPDIVCDDSFEQIDAESACYTLGYTNGGSFQTTSMDWSESEIPFWMDDVQCDSASTNFLSCSSSGWGVHNCDHDENVILTCFASGKKSSTFSGLILFGFHLTFYRISFTEQLKIMFFRLFVFSITNRYR